MKHKWLTKRIMLLGAMCILTLSGCTKISEDFSDDVQQEEVNEEDGLIAKAKNQMKDFIMAVNAQNYDGISDLVYMPANSFIHDDNIEWYVNRSALGDITGININKLEIEVSEGALKKEVTVYVNKDGYSFEMALDSDNVWKVILPELYVENWSIKIPKGCTANIDGIDISEYKIPATVVDDYDTYTFSAIAKQEMMVNTVSSIYGEFQQKISPVSNSESIPIICVINDDETNNILSRIQDIWNGLYKDYVNQVGVEAVKKYFTDDFDNTEITNIMTAYFPALETGPSDSEAGQIKYSNFYMKEAIPWTKDNYGSAILKSDNTVEVNLGYRIDFVSDIVAGSYSVRKATQITVAYVDAPELGAGAKTYKIQKLNDTKMFTDNDYNSNDY